jgi:TPR repeat protein
MSGEDIAAARRAARCGDFVTAVSVLRPLAEAGRVDAQFELGHLVLTECELLSGQEGFAWLQAAADRGHPRAMYEVATYPSFPREPFRSPLNTSTSWDLLLRAAEAGLTEAQYHAGACLATGEFGDEAIPADLAAAVGWYRRASEAGHAEAQFNLGLMLIHGEGCRADRTEGVRWLHEAAKGGDKQASRVLAELRVESGT